MIYISKASFEVPDIKKLNLKGFSAVDMHFHTNYSFDGISVVKDVLKLAKKKGIGVAITDHNAIKGSLKAARKGVMIIPGIEVTSSEGTHTLYYFNSFGDLQKFYDVEMKHWLDKNPYKIGYSKEELMERSKDYNAIISAAHPYSPGPMGTVNTGIKKSMIKKLHGVEAINGYNMRYMNIKSINLAEKYNKGMTGGTDGHTTPELGQTVTYSEGSNVEDFLESISKKQSRVAGIEENIFLKAELSILKEEVSLIKANQEHHALQLIEHQFNTEAVYLRNKIKDIFKHYNMHH